MHGVDHEHPGRADDEVVDEASGIATGEGIEVEIPLFSRSRKAPAVVGGSVACGR
jgi:hypothetical protein